MNEHHSSSTKDRLKRHQFASLLVGAITIAMIFVMVSLSLYQSSGTIQLDLSRPGYDQARKEATKDKTFFRGFSPDGEINDDTLSEFSKLYKKKQAQADAIDAYSGEPLSDKTLNLE